MLFDEDEGGERSGSEWATFVRDGSDDSDASDDEARPRQKEQDGL